MRNIEEIMKLLSEDDIKVLRETLLANPNFLSDKLSEYKQEREQERIRQEQESVRQEQESVRQEQKEQNRINNLHALYTQEKDKILGNRLFGKRIKNIIDLVGEEYFINEYFEVIVNCWKRPVLLNNCLSECLTERDSSVPLTEEFAIKKIKIENSNAEKFFVSSEHFLNELVNCFKYFEQRVEDESLDVKDRIGSRLSLIAVEYTMQDILNLYAYNHEEFEKKYWQQDCMGDLDEEYRFLGYQYGEMIGIEDNEIINKGFIISKYIDFINIIKEIISKGINCYDYYSFYYDNQWNIVYCENIRDNDNFIVSEPDSKNRIPVSYINVRYLDLMNKFPEKYEISESLFENVNFQSIINVYNTLLSYYKKIGFDKNKSGKFCLESIPEKYDDGVTRKIKFRTQYVMM